MNDSALRPVLAKAISLIVRPLIKFWLKKGYSYQAFDEIMRWTFVDIADKNFKLDTKKLTDSRISVITGLTRHQVKHYRTITLEESPENAKSNRSTRVLTGWLTDEAFHADGKPAVLEIQEGDMSFAELVKKYGGDISHKAVLDDLLHSGQVEYSGKSSLRLLSKGYVPSDDEAALVEIIGHDAAVLLDTLEHNLYHGKGEKFFQKKVCYDNVAEADLSAFKKLSGTKAQKLLEELNDELRKISKDDAHMPVPAYEVGMGIYYFQKKTGE